MIQYTEDLTYDINKYAEKYLYQGESKRDQYRELSFLYTCMLKEKATMCICEELKDHPNIYGVKMKLESHRRLYYAFLAIPGEL